MKPIMIAAPIAIALLSGCAGPTYVKGTAAEAPKNVAAAEEDVDFIAPDPMFAPPGTYEMDWEPKEAPPEPEIKPRKMIAKPHMVSEKQRGRLFVLPTTYEH